MQQLGAILINKKIKPSIIKEEKVDFLCYLYFFLDLMY